MTQFSGLELPKRTSKPRQIGITSIHDVGISTRELEGLLADFGDYLDFAKFGVGSAYVMPKLKDKVQLYRDHGVSCYVGGTLFEKYHHQGKIDALIENLQRLGFDMVEVSTGTTDIPLEERVDLCRHLSQYFTVVSEVGTKDKEAVMPPSQWIAEITALLDAECSYVITEGRDSGTAGIFNASGSLRTDLLTEIIANLDTDRIIFEAPTASSQMHLINTVGSNVNLGNVAPRDLLLLEAQRQGLRSETFFLES